MCDEGAPTVEESAQRFHDKLLEASCKTAAVLPCDFADACCTQVDQAAMAGFFHVLYVFGLCHGFSFHIRRRRRRPSWCACFPPFSLIVPTLSFGGQTLKVVGRASVRLDVDCDQRACDAHAFDTLRICDGGDLSIYGSIIGWQKRWLAASPRRVANG